MNKFNIGDVVFHVSDTKRNYPALVVEFFILENNQFRKEGISNYNYKLQYNEITLTLPEHLIIKKEEKQLRNPQEILDVLKLWGEVRDNISIQTIIDYIEMKEIEMT